MGVDAGDYDGSGRPSLWVTTFQGELQALFRNLGRGFQRFISIPRVRGLPPSARLS